MNVPLKSIYTLPLAIAGFSWLFNAGFPQSSHPQAPIAQIATPRPTVTASPPSRSMATPAATPQPTPSCLDDRQASVAISSVFTREQTRQAVALLKEGKNSRAILKELNLSVEQKRELRTIGRQKCKKNA